MPKTVLKLSGVPPKTLWDLPWAVVIKYLFTRFDMLAVAAVKNVMGAAPRALGQREVRCGRNDEERFETKAVQENNLMRQQCGRLGDGCAASTAAARSAVSLMIGDPAGLFLLTMSVLVLASA